MIHCTSKLETPPSEKFRFHQISHFLHSISSQEPLPLAITPCEQWCSSAMDMRGGISLIYSALAEPREKATYMLSWERNIGFEWDLVTWHSHFTCAYKGILNISLAEADLKVISRWYLVPTHPAKFYPRSSPLCFRGCGHLGSLLHIFWECPRIRGYWKKIFNLIRKVTGKTVPQNPIIALLNQKIPKLPKSDQIPIHFILIGAKLTIARAWKSPKVSFYLTKYKVSWIMYKEKISNIILDKIEKCKWTWELWAHYIGVSL